ncbi:MAG: hypothetical protein Q9225_004069 [Loekoesia sp. 1 TL-2023]
MSAEEPPLDEPGFDLYANQQGRVIATSVALIWDDFLAVIALVFCIVTCSLNFVRMVVLALHLLPFMLTSFVEIHHGFGRHIYIYGQEGASVKTRLWLRTLYVFEPMYHTSTTFAKYSILAFYYRIFSILQFRRMLYINAGLVTCYVVSVDLVCLFQCTPVHSFWDVGVQGNCVNIDRFFIASGSVNVVLDFIIFALPIPLLWRLRTSFNQKLILTAIFTVAGFVVIVSIVRIVVLSRIGKRDLTCKLYPSGPPPLVFVTRILRSLQTGNYINGAIWAVTEPSVAVICACLPSLRPLFAIVSRGLAHPSSQKFSIGIRSSGSGKWLKGKVSKGSSDDNNFSRLDDLEDPGQMGHNVAVHGGRDGNRVEMGEVPETGIKVETEVVLISSERLDYKDKLF